MNYTRLYIPYSIVFITVVTNKRREIFIENIELLKHSIFSCIDKNKEYKRLF